MNIVTLATPAVWAGFAVLVVAVLVIDLGIFNRKAHVVLGLRSLYFVLAGAAERFKYVQPGLALVLMFVGAKMAISDWIKIPVLVSLGVIVVLVGGSIVLSVLRTGEQREIQPR